MGFAFVVDVCFVYFWFFMLVCLLVGVLTLILDLLGLIGVMVCCVG